MAHSVLLHLLTTGFGTKLPFQNVRYPSAYEGKAEKMSGGFGFRAAVEVNGCYKNT
jgi:hypothetical protein